MGKAHKNVGAVVMIFVLVIGIAECRNLKEDEVISGVGASGNAGGAVARNYVVGFGDRSGGFIVSEPASGLGAGVGGNGNAGGAVGRNFFVVSEPASGLGAGVGASGNAGGAVGRNFVVVSEPASGLGFSSAGSGAAVGAGVGQGVTGATAAGGGL